LIQEATDGPLAAQKVAAHFFKELSGREAPGNWAKLYDEWVMPGLCLGYVWVMSGLYLVSFGSQTFQFALEHE
jgi:hypothetical protein